MKQNRRNFLQSVGPLVALPFLGSGNVLAGESAAPKSIVSAPLDPDLVVYNAKVYTVDDAMPKAEAFAVKNGRFVAVGSNTDIKALIKSDTKSVDAKQMSVVPGFIDCHNHAGGESLLYSVLVGNPFEVEFVTIDSIVEKLKKKASEVPPGTWVEGSFHDDTKVKDNRPLTLADLDRVSKDHPVAVRHRGGHTTFYNSKAFEMAKVTENIKDPFGGTFDRDASGKLNGRVTDRARSVFTGVGIREKFTPEQSMERSRAGMAHISKQFVKYGLTSVHHSGGDLAAMQYIRSKGQLLHRINYELSQGVMENMIANGMQTGFGDEWIRIGSTTEHSIDGSFSERTMSLSVPYPGLNGYKGNVTETQETLNDWMEKVHRAGIQVNCHANGDVAIDMYLTAFERAQKLFPRADARPKITHCTLMTDDLVRRIKAVDAIPLVFTTYAYYNSDKFPSYGEDLMKKSMAFREMLDAGIHAAAGSDFSPGPFAPLMGMQGMVTRRGWDGKTWGANQKVSVAEALKILTLHGAYASHEDDVKGSITTGKYADYLMLAEDPHTIDPEKIKDIKIVQTVTGGKTVYEG